MECFWSLLDMFVCDGILDDGDDDTHADTHSCATESDERHRTVRTEHLVSRDGGIR